MILAAHLLLGIIGYWLNFRKTCYNWCNLVYILIKLCFQSFILYLNNDVTILRFAKEFRGMFPLENL